MVIGTSSWDLYKARCRTEGNYDSALYMRLIESISRTYALSEELKGKITGDINLSFDSDISSIITTHTSEGYVINIPLSWIENGNASCYTELSTFIGHEFSHIYYNDIEFLDSLVEGAIRNRRSFTLAALCESRADILGCYLSQKYNGSYTLSWVKTSNNYMKTGCFDDVTRDKIVRNCKIYDIVSVLEIFKNIIEKDKFTSYSTVLNSVKKDGRLSDAKRRWMLRILCFA